MSRYATVEERLAAILFAGPRGAPAFNVSARKVGGLWFWRIGRLGGSVYLARGA